MNIQINKLTFKDRFLIRPWYWFLSFLYYSETDLRKEDTAENGVDAAIWNFIRQYDNDKVKVDGLNSSSTGKLYFSKVVIFQSENRGPSKGMRFIGVQVKTGNYSKTCNVSRATVAYMAMIYKGKVRDKATEVRNIRKQEVLNSICEKMVEDAGL